MSASNLSTRVITALVLIGGLVAIGIIAAAWPAMKWLFLVLGFAVTVGSAWEFARFSTVAENELVRRVMYLLCLVAPAVVTLIVLSSTNICDAALTAERASRTLAGAVLTFLLFVIAFVVVSGDKDLRAASRTWHELLPAYIHISLGGCALMILGVYGDAVFHLMWLVLVIASNDSAAYFVGRRLGGPKLAPVISPNKTVSGSVGGIVVGTLIGTVSASLLEGQSAGLCIAAFSVVMVIAAQLGDLIKSYLKRVHGVKDSGSLLPGHGGILDRVDGYLLSAPFLVLFLFW